jgi:hypothetical protein
VTMKLKKALDTKNLLRRSISLAKIVDKLAHNGNLYKYVNSWVCGTLSERFVLYTLTYTGPASWVCALCVAVTNSPWKHVC